MSIYTWFYTKHKNILSSILYRSITIKKIRKTICKLLVCIHYHNPTIEAQISKTIDKKETKKLQGKYINSNADFYEACEIVQFCRSAHQVYLRVVKMSDKSVYMNLVQQYVHQIPPPRELTLETSINLSVYSLPDKYLKNPKKSGKFLKKKKKKSQQCESQ